MKYQWSQLRPLSKLDQLAETILKTAFLLSENHHVIKSYLNHKGPNFKVVNRVGESEYDIICRQINIEKTNYAFVSKSDLESGLRDDLWVGLVLFVDGQKPTKYLFPSIVWNQPNQLFTDSAVRNSEYGINLNKNTMKSFVEKYSFEKMIKNL
ncbi:hypothetical protein [Fulvivirga ligni]|uniref:hypothetical protein n=1 Tax=Fulvivirga ligni TaxID=2904246 RepID=UPI001F3CF813|nr:hypothetical protein [Fulvivirga ligni]UII19389.1 hypothetical protein LVD16_16225 [Fulvivirga ligni]